MSNPTAVNPEQAPRTNEPVFIEPQKAPPTNALSPTKAPPTNDPSAKIGPAAATTAAAAVPINAVIIKNVSPNISGMNLVENTYAISLKSFKDTVRQNNATGHSMAQNRASAFDAGLARHNPSTAVAGRVCLHHHGQGTYPRIDCNPARIIVTRLLNDENVSCKFNMWSEKGLLTRFHVSTKKQLAMMRDSHKELTWAQVSSARHHVSNEAMNKHMGYLINEMTDKSTN
jgi:hypothetical protein